MKQGKTVRIELTKGIFCAVMNEEGSGILTAPFLKTLLPVDYDVTNFKCQGDLSTFQLWDDNGYIFTYEVSTVDFMDALKDKSVLFHKN